jgi:hypothetical protein
MNPFVSIPREALAELLRNAGSPLTPEQYLAALPQVGVSKKYSRRAWAAACSKYGLLIVAVLGVVLYPFLGDYLINGIIVIGLITVTYFEYRVHRYFLEGNPEAPSLGFRNQSIFAAAILIYCLYHAFAPVPLSHDDMTMLEENNLIDPNSLKSLVRTIYLLVGIIAGGSQFWLAWYYRGAQGDAPTLPPLPTASQ